MEHMEQAREIAAQCWCDEDTSGIIMDPILCEAIARRIASWIDMSAQMSRNSDFYRGLLGECAIHIGPTAYTADDGRIHDSPIMLNIPGLVGDLVRVNNWYSGSHLNT